MRGDFEMMRLRGSKFGTSLIEVLVMMFVLLVGIMTIVRMFPGGFLLLRRAENQTFAARLAQAEIERWKLHAANLPAGILPIDADGDKMDPGPPFNRGNYTNDQRVLGWRRIIGETVKIPVAGEVQTSNGPIDGAVYLLGFSPIKITAPDYLDLKIYSSPLRRYVRNSDNSDDDPWEWLPPTGYAIDYSDDEGNPKIAFPSLPYDRNYDISYAWWERPLGEPNEGPTLRTTTESITVPANTEAWLEAPCEGYDTLEEYAGANSVQTFGMDDNSDTVSRGFRILQPWDSWSGDPYEYKILDDITGIIVFNPNGYNYMEQTPQGVRPLVARIDYDILDPGIMREDKAVSSHPPFNLKLTLNYVIEDEELIPGFMWRDDINLLIVDSVDGSKIPIVGNNVVDAGGALMSGLVDVNYKAGSITFLQDTIPAVDLSGQTIDKYVPGRTFRVYYKADGDWVVQVLKPFEAYDRQDDAGIDYRHYYLDNNQYLYFPICDSGKSVAVAMTWVDTNSDLHSVAGEQYQISEDTMSVGAYNWCYVDLWSKHPEIASGNNLSIRGVWGTSLKVRVFWRDGPRIPGLPPPSWHFADAETSLQRQAGEL